MSQAELSVSTPGKLIRWHYLWYAAVALVIMVAVIVSGHLWSLNFVHVFSGLLWTGIDLFMGFVLGPILRVVDVSARKAVLLRLTPRTLFLMPTLSIITGTTGWFFGQGHGVHRPELAAIRMDRGGDCTRGADGNSRARIPAAHEFAGLPGAATEQPRPDQDCQADEPLFHGRRVSGCHASGHNRHHGAFSDRYLIP